MEGYDNMDNNLNNNGSGIPNVSDIKFDDTPAESFDNLYGGTSQVSGNNGVGTMSNPSVPNMSGVGVQPSVGNSSFTTSTPIQSGNVGVQSQPSVQSQAMQSSNSTGLNAVNGQSAIMPNNSNPAAVNNNMGVSSNPQVISNPGVVTSTPVQPVNVGTQSQSNMNGMVNQTVSNPVNVEPMAQVNPGIAPNINQGPMITPNSVNVTNNGIGLSNVDIDAERMQSIEEQLSKTSQYNPEDLQQEKITIPTDNQYEKNKSGLAFVIVLFIILAVVIAFLPQITKLIN